MIKVEHNVETGEIKEIELTPEEIQAYEKEAQEMAAIVAQREADAEAKAAARQAILDRLGLTADEAALLLGAN